MSTRNPLYEIWRAVFKPMIWVASLTLTFAMAGTTAADPLTIWNGVDGKGSLTVTVDDFGAYGTFVDGPDVFDPGGDLDSQAVTFLSYIQASIDPSEIGDGTHRRVVSEHPAVLGLYGTGNMNLVITQPNTQESPSEVSSAFDIIGDGVHLAVELTQRASLGPTGPNGLDRAMLEQSYAVTNVDDAPVELIVTRNVDHDIPWYGGALLTVVGMEEDELGWPQVIATHTQAVYPLLLLRTDADLCDDPHTTENSQSGACNNNYYVGKQNLPAPPGNPHYPGGDCPQHDYGTDLQIWDNYGLPNCWKNFVPGCGYNVPCISPEVQGDTFFGLQTAFELAPGETYNINYQMLYAYGSPTAEIIHRRGKPLQTRPHTGYIDPRAEVGFPPNPPDPAGLTEAFIEFNTDVYDCGDLSEVDIDDFILVETGGGQPPVITEVELVDPDRPYVRVAWDRPITLEEWTTLIAIVCDADGDPIFSLGDLGPEELEPDRVDIAFLPANVDQGSSVEPFDLLRFRQLVNSGDEPEYGLSEDYVDINRDDEISPFDLLALRQLINGTPPATQSWQFHQLNNPQP